MCRSRSGVGHGCLNSFLHPWPRSAYRFLRIRSPTVNLTEFEADLRNPESDSTDAPPYLWRVWDGLSSEDRKRLLRLTWMMTRWPRCKLGTRSWLAMFRATGYLSPDVDLGLGDYPSGPMKLFRGHDEAHLRGMSWTNNFNVAARFARANRACRPPTFVFVVTVPPHAVLATIPERGEGEVVINPNCLRGSASPEKCKRFA